MKGSSGLKTDDSKGSGYEVKDQNSKVGLGFGVLGWMIWGAPLLLGSKMLRTTLLKLDVQNCTVRRHLKHTYMHKTTYVHTCIHTCVHTFMHTYRQTGKHSNDTNAQRNPKTEA